MAEPVLIFGTSGSGKTTSLEKFGSKEILLFNTLGKRLPFRTKFDYVVNTDNVDTIKSQLAKMPCKVAVIDDAGYIMSNHFMREHSKVKVGSSQFDLYNSIADEMFGLFMFIKKKLPDDVIVYIIFHEERNDDGGVKLLTIGKLLDQKCNLAGMVTIAIHAMVRDNRHIFVTNSEGYDITKTPKGMFDMEIPNDLKMVDTTIREFWGMTPAEEKDATV